MTNWRTAKLALAFAASGALTSCALLQQGSLKQPPDFDNGRIEQGALVIEGVPDIPLEVKENLLPYQNVRSHSFQDWFLGGVLITTRFGETSQAHHLVMPGGMRRQLTFYDEPVSNVDASPTQSSFLFSKDIGGDEFYQGYNYTLKSEKAVAFTQSGTRNGGFTWADDGLHAAWYEAQDGDPNYVIKVGDPNFPSTIHTALRGAGAIFPIDWSADGKTLLLQQYVSILKSRMFTFELETGALTEINPDDNVAYSGGYLLEDGSVLTVTDSPAATPTSPAVAADSRATAGRAVRARCGSPSCSRPASSSIRHPANTTSPGRG